MRARYRKRGRRRGSSFGWNIAIAAVVVVGVLLIVLTVSGNDESSAGPPFAANQATGQAGSHWHTYLGMNICGEWLPPVPAFEQPVGAPAGTQNAGIHSHGDGLIHTHPFVRSEAGSNATFGKFADYADFSVSSDSIDAWAAPKGDPGKKSWSNGDTCTFGDNKGKQGRVVWAVDGKPRNGNPSDYLLKDGETLAIGFLPKGVELGFPPDACTAFANISDQQTAAVVSKDSPCRAQASTPTTTIAP